MVVAISLIELHIPAARSLKGKRRVVKSLVERIHQRFRVSIAETAYHDKHQRCQIVIAAVHTSDHQMERLLEKIRQLIDNEFEAELVVWEPEFLEYLP